MLAKLAGQSDRDLVVDLLSDEDGSGEAVGKNIVSAQSAVVLQPEEIGADEGASGSTGLGRLRLASSTSAADNATGLQREQTTSPESRSKVEKPDCEMGVSEHLPDNVDMEIDVLVPPSVVYEGGEDGSGLAAGAVV